MQASSSVKLNAIYDHLPPGFEIPVVPRTRQQVGQSLKDSAKRISRAIQQTMSEKQRRDYDQHTCYAIYVYPQLEKRIVSKNRCDDNIEAKACAAAQSSIIFDLRGDVLRSIYNHVQMILNETGFELLNDQFPLSDSRKKAVEESGPVLSLLDLLAQRLCKYKQSPDWHTDLQSLLPLFVTLHQKGLFADNWKLFARCERIHST